MRSVVTVRNFGAFTLLAACVALGHWPLHAQNPRVDLIPMAQVGTAAGDPQGQGRVGPVQRRPNSVGPHGEHLAEWMDQHRNLSPAQQQQALDREPGFRDLPQATQQRFHERLAQLNAMPPQERERLLAHNEAMEHLSPDQRADVRGALQQLGSLPLDRRRMVARTFRQLRELPPEQRIPTLNSDRFRGVFTDGERATLYDLLRIEPMLPPPDNGQR